MNDLEQIQNYITRLVDFGVNLYSQSIPENELPHEIYQILTTESHLAKRPDPEFKKVIVGKIRQTIKEQKPLKLVLTTGGFKNYAAKNAPHVDWAEVFAVKNMLDLCVPIAQIYAPGVELEYSGDSYAVPIFNNMPTSMIDVYVREFEEVLSVFQRYLPSNVRLSQKNIDEFYDVEDLERRMRDWVNNVKRDRPKVDEYIQQFYIKAKNNFMVQGATDYSQVTAQEMDGLLMESILLDRAWLEIDISERREYLEGGVTIPVIHTSVPGCIALKSVNMRKIAFWLGNGVLMIDDDRILPNIIHGTKFIHEEGVSYAGVTSPFGGIYGFDSVPYMEMHHVVA